MAFWWIVVLAVLGFVIPYAAAQNIDTLGPDLIVALELDPCEFHTVKADNPYRSTSYPEDDIPHCDIGFFDKDTWYRFGTDGIWGTMPESCVPNGFCGTQIPLWLNGAHPTESDPGPKTLPVCGKFFWEPGCCGWTADIRVKWCTDDKGPFYVYELEPVDGCDMAYCAGSKEPCPVGKKFIKETDTCEESFPVQTAVPSLSEPLLYAESGDAFYFECIVHYDCTTNISSQARFQIEFLVSDVTSSSSLMMMKNVSCEDFPAKLDYSMLRTHLNKQLQCTAQSYWSQDEPPVIGSPKRYSNLTWLGIESNPAAVTITVPDDLEKIINLTPTIPLGCDCCPYWNTSKGCAMIVRFAMEVESIGQKDNDDYVCNYVIDKDNPQTSITLRGDVKKKNVKESYSNDVFQISFDKWLYFDDRSQSIFYDYAPPPIPVHIVDKVARPQCRSTGDPHITTFDGKEIHVYRPKVYYLVNRVIDTDARVFQVQARHFNRESHHPARNCAVAVRENDDIIGIDNCNGINNMRYFRHLHGNGGLIKVNGITHTIIMPSGSLVKVNVYGEHINIFVTAIKEDFNKTDGLCGNFDGDPKNDIDENLGDDIIPDKDNYNYIHTYTNKYIVPLNESLFDSNNTFECTGLGLYPSTCLCKPESNEVICGHPKDFKEESLEDSATIIDVEFSHPIGVEHCNATRKKRSTDGDDDDDDDYSDNIYDDVYTPPDMSTEYIYVEPSWPTQGGITQTEAEAACSNGVDKSPAACKELVQWERLYKECVTDIQAMDSLHPAAEIATILDTTCAHAAEISVEYMNGEPVNPEALEVATAIQQAVCPNQCSDHGQCQNGACVCDSGYSAADCSVDVVSPPTIEALIPGGPCDVQKRPCRSVRISASNINYSTQIKCKLQYTGLNSIGAEETMETVVDAQEASSFQLKCPLPDHWVTRIPHSSGFDMPWTKMMISISNDGSSFSMTQSLFIHDSVCITCDEETCTQKPDSCLINGRCYASGHLSDGCKTCDPVLDTLEWTQLDASQCEIAKERTTTSSTTTRTINGSRRTTTAPQRPSPIWGPWSNCSRDCDYGEMKRQCQSECSENSENKVCWMQRCPERPEQVNRGVFIDVDQEAVMVASSSLSLRESVASAINTRCAGEDPGVCCRALGKTASLSIDLLNQRELVTVDNVKISNGYPHRLDNSKTRVSLYVAVPKTLVDLVCVEESDRMVKRAAGDDDTVVYFDKEILYTIIDDNTDSIKQSSGLAISSTYLGPGATGPQEGWTWQLWMTVVIACCGGLVLLVVIIVVAFCIHRQKKKRGNPQEKENRYVANDYENVKHPSASYLQTTDADVNNKMDGCYSYVDQNMGNNPQNECAEHVYEEMNNDKIVNEKRPGSASSTSSKLAWM